MLDMFAYAMMPLFTPIRLFIYAMPLFR